MVLLCYMCLEFPEVILESTPITLTLFSKTGVLGLDSCIGFQPTSLCVSRVQYALMNGLGFKPWAPVAPSLTVSEAGAEAEDLVLVRFRSSGFVHSGNCIRD